MVDLFQFKGNWPLSLTPVFNNALHIPLWNPSINDLKKTLVQTSGLIKNKINYFPIFLPMSE